MVVVLALTAMPRVLNAAGTAKPAPRPVPVKLQQTAAHWSETLPRLWEHAERPVERALLDAALAVIGELASGQGEQVLLHQDLHTGNVLRAQREPWLVIDPKPLHGEREFGPECYRFALQAPLLGTCHATLQAQSHLPADAQTTLDALQRTAVMEFRYFKDVISEKNPNAKYRMEIIHGNGTEPVIHVFERSKR